MKFSVITIFPEMLAAITDFGVVSRAVKQGTIAVHAYNPRDYTEDRHRTVDDRPFGGGPGMVMTPKPLVAAIDDAKASAQHAPSRVIYLSPQGTPFTQAKAIALSQLENIILIAGRYEGIDQRVIDRCVDEEISIGDFVVSGGELPAMMVMDAVSRCLPNVLGHQESAAQDSFSEGLLDCPHYTRPVEYQGEYVPDVLMSGHHKAIEQWRLMQSVGQTWLKRPDILKQLNLTDEQQRLLAEFQEQWQANSETGAKS